MNLYLILAVFILASGFKPTFRTLHCHNRFLRNFVDHINHLYTHNTRLDWRSQVQFPQTPKIRSVTHSLVRNVGLKIICQIFIEI